MSYIEIRGLQPITRQRKKKSKHVLFYFVLYEKHNQVNDSVVYEALITFSILYGMNCNFLTFFKHLRKFRAGKRQI